MQRLIRIVRDFLLGAVILLLMGLVAVRLDRPQEAMSGHARVVDGDTLVLYGKRVRLAGIDAPELRQVCQRDGQAWPCGTAAKSYLSGLIGDAQTACDADGSDKYGRLLAVCTVANRDLNAAMVADGYAIAFGNYQAEEAAARQKRLGLWAGTFDIPRAWRQSHGGMDEMPHMPQGWLQAAITGVGHRIKDAMSKVWND